MTDQLETDLRSVFAAQATEIPTDAAVQRLRGVDFRPRGPRLRTGIALGGAVGGLAGISAVAVSLVGLGAGSPPAFASWSATPTTAPASQTAAAEAACIARIPTPSSLAKAEADATNAGPNSPAKSLQSTAPAEWHTVLADTRGSYTMLILEATPEGRASCLANSSGPAILAVGPSGSQAASPPPAGQVEVFSYGTENTPAGQTYSQIEGHVGAGVTGVSMTLQDGTNVTATVANGWYLAWWPGTDRAVAEEVTTAAGTSTQQLSNP
jgi:hypothetical protein